MSNTRKIVYCCDGTWNDPQDRTNVLRLKEALVVSDDQIPCYHEGVGNEGRWWKRVWAGATGEGLVGDVKESYAEIAKNLTSSTDEIYLFGFSRGAFTARSVGGMIAYCGLPLVTDDGERDALVDMAFGAYQTRKQQARKANEKMSADPWTDKPKEMVAGNIRMIGVWDTVGRLGVPGSLFKGLNRRKYRFLDTALNPNVAGYHALALDERRRPFQPTLWDPPTPGSKPVEQVWFGGVHGDVGGSAPPLGDITLAWMLDKCRAQELEVTDEAARRYLDAYDSSTAAGVIRRFDWRWGLPKVRTVENRSHISESARTWIEADSSYLPPLRIHAGNPRILDPDADYTIAQVLTPKAVPGS